MGFGSGPHRIRWILYGVSKTRYVLIDRIPWFDPVGGIAVGILIAKTGIDLLSGNYYNLMDRQDLDENKSMMEHCE